MPNKDTFDVSEEFSRSSNPVLLFLDERCQDLSRLNDEEVSTVFDDFCQFCECEGCSKMSRTMFARRMKAAVHGLDVVPTKRRGMSVRVFRGQSLKRDY